jgi:tetratricopeptide (TPR) repeat protein
MARRESTKRRSERRLANNSPQRAPWKIPDKVLDWLIVAGLLILTAVVYAQVVGFEFTNYDDTAYVPDNAQVRDGFTLRGVGWAFTTFETANWYPLTWLSLMLDCQLFGPRAGAIHAANALLHAADSLLLFVVLRRMTGRRWPSAAVAVLFAIHPSHVESVAWVAERKDVLSTLFFLLTLLAYHWYAARPSLSRWTLVFLSMAVGLLTKPMLVTLPFVLLLLDYWPLRSPRRPLGLLLAEKVPLLVLSAVASKVTMVAQASQGATEMIGDKVNLSLRLGNAAISYVKYLSMTFWPADLAVFYPYDFQPPAQLVIKSTVVLCIVTLVAVLLLRRAPYVGVGWFWYLGTLVPTIGFVQVGAQGLADRYLYIPSIGIFIAVVWAVSQVVRRPLPLAAGFIVIVAALSFVAHLQVSYWANSELLFRHALAVTGDNPESCENLGDTLLHHDRFEEAEKEFRTVLRLEPKQFTQTPGELARAIAGQNRIAEAVSLIHESIPDKVERAKALTGVGMFLALHFQLNEGIPLLEEAIQTAPEQSEPYRNLAYVYATCPKKDVRDGRKAVELATKACELSKWSSTQCLVTLADAYLEVGDREHQIEKLREAQKISPKDAAIAKKLSEALKAQP